MRDAAPCSAIADRRRRRLSLPCLSLAHSSAVPLSRIADPDRHAARNRVSFGDQSVSLTSLFAVGEAASEFPDGEGADPVSGVSIGFAGSGVASIGVATGVLLKGIDLGASMS